MYIHIHLSLSLSLSIYLSISLSLYIYIYMLHIMLGGTSWRRSGTAHEVGVKSYSVT